MITNKQAADLVAYVVAFTHTQINGAEAATWCDYLNSREGAPEATAEDFAKAVRIVCREWGRKEGYKSPINPEDLARQVRKARRQRLEAWERVNGPLVPPLQLCDDPRKAQAWMIEQRQAIMNGQTPQNALERDKNARVVPMPTKLKKARLRAI